MVIQIFQNTITKEDRRYQHSWPWGNQNHNLPKNYELLLGRLKTQMKCFEKDRDLLQRYNKIIKDQLSKGVIEKFDEKNGNSKTLYTTPRYYYTGKEYYQSSNCIRRVSKNKKEYEES